MATSPAYAFDPTGVLAANKIAGEQQVLTAANYRDFHFVVPTYGPFFADGAVVKFRALDNSVRTLTEGIDFYFTHWFISASRACAKPIYGSISLLDLELTGVVVLDYQTLGGDWLQNTAKITEILGDQLHNPRTTAFDQVIDMPYSFPVIDHPWDLADLTGATELVAQLNDIAVAIRGGGGGGGSGEAAAHIADLNNPHQTTKAQIGLGNVQNYPIATGPITITGTSGVHYVTPFGVKAALDAGPNAAIAAHVGRTDNPHGTTAAQVGAYSQAQMNTLLANKLAIGGTAYDTSRFDAKTPTEYRDWVLLGTAANSVKFNGLSPAEFRDYALTGKAADSTLFNGVTYAAAIADARSGNAANALKFGGLTPSQYKADVLLGTASNSAQFSGQTAAQWEAYLGGIFGSAGNTTAQGTQLGNTGQGAGSYWYELGRGYFPGADPLSTQQDMHWLITGGDSANDRLSTLWYLHMSTRGAAGSGVSAKLINFDGSVMTDQLGWTKELLDDGSGTPVDTLRVWYKSRQNHGTITVTDLAQHSHKPLSASTAVAVEPATITYLTEDIAGVASKKDVADLRTEVETFITAMTTAFTDLAATVGTPP